MTPFIITLEMEINADVTSDGLIAIDEEKCAKLGHKFRKVAFLVRARVMHVPPL